MLIYVALIVMAVGRFDYNLIDPKTERVGLGITTEETFTQKLDHFNAQNSETWVQRYFDNKDNWDRPNGPTIVYICGEWVCSPPSRASYIT